MIYGGDFDDAINVVDVWLHANPGRSIWERDEYAVPYEDEVAELNFDRSQKQSAHAGA